MLSAGFLLTSLVVVLMPGTGVLYTVATGLCHGKRASFFAALGCTLGIIPALLASSFGLAAIFHTSAVAFSVVKYAGCAYLLYLAWQMWRSSGPLAVSGEAQGEAGYVSFMIKGFLLNILNPKLSIFFLAFLPQFITGSDSTIAASMLLHGSVFMLMNFAVFLVYGGLSGLFSARVLKSEKVSVFIQKFFATSFAALGLKLAFSEQR